jgi:hypothetical protein
VRSVAIAAVVHSRVIRQRREAVQDEELLTIISLEQLLGQFVRIVF